MTRWEWQLRWTRPGGGFEHMCWCDPQKRIIWCDNCYTVRPDLAVFTNKKENKMSWSISTKVVPKSAIGQAIEDLSLADTGMVPSDHAVDQLETAKRGALEILKSIPGPYMSVSLSGHSNGVGWSKKDGYANDCINVSVVQHTEEPQDVI